MIQIDEARIRDHLWRMPTPAKRTNICAATPRMIFPCERQRVRPTFETTNVNHDNPTSLFENGEKILARQWAEAAEQSLLREPLATVDQCKAEKHLRIAPAVETR